MLGLIGDMHKNRFEIFRSLTMLRQLAIDPALISDKYEDIGSAKLDQLITQLQEVAAEGHRALVFSQFTRFLARVKDRLAEAGIAFASLDGSTRNRDMVITSFKEGDAPVFLISLKSGGFGLNLTKPTTASSWTLGGIRRPRCRLSIVPTESVARNAR